MNVIIVRNVLILMALINKTIVKWHGKSWDNHEWGMLVKKGNEMVYPWEKAPCWSALVAMQDVKAMREAQKPHADCTVPEQNTWLEVSVNINLYVHGALSEK